MSEQYTRELLRIAVAQICQTIGYHATQTSSLELMQDLLHRFLHEFARDMRQHVQHYNRNSANLHDVKLTLSSLNINISELLDYISNVEPVGFVYEVPKFPAHKPTNLNFLKPGSKEVLSRPVHIFEHLPPMLEPETPQSQFLVNENSSSAQDKSTSNEDVILGSMPNALVATKTETDNDSKSHTPTRDNSRTVALMRPPVIAAIGNQTIIDEHGRSTTREISSVVMTTGGFISPAIEGKLPETGIPDLIDKLFGLDEPPPPTPPPPPESSLTSDVRTQSDTPAALTATEKPKLNPGQGKSTENIKKKGLSLSHSHAPTTSKKQLENNRAERGDPSRKMTPNTNPKKQSNPQQNPLQQQPTMASKLLKKAKKKNAGHTSSSVGLPGNAIIDDDLAATAGMDMMLNEKARRKRMKMLQKLAKNSQKSINPKDALATRESKDPKWPSPAIVAQMPPGAERTRLEKLLKKHAKQKQKQLKKQLALETQMLFSGNQSKDISTSGSESKSKQEQAHISQVELPGLAALSSQVAPAAATFGVDTAYSALNPAPSSFSDIKPLDLKTQEVDAAPSMEKKSGLEIKLSNEPDRSKLNIFKKISKAQKGAQVAAATKQPVSSSTNVFTGSEGQIINLPSGTTITPAPPLLPAATDFAATNFLGKNVVGTDDAMKHALQNVGALLVAPPLAGDAQVMNKPKKRGRKPGSKNQAKLLPPAGALMPLSQTLTQPLLKKPKKLKAEKNNIGAEGNNYTMSAELIQSQQVTSGTMGFPPNILPSSPFVNPAFSATPSPTQKGQRKERKEKEKLKAAEVNANLLDLQTHKELKPSSPADFGGVQLKPVNLLLNNPSVPPSERALSTPKSKKRSAATHKSPTPPAAAMLPGFLPGVTPPPGFPNMPSSMLPMLPFPFASRPGLIPGFFPPGAGGLPNFPHPLGNPVGANASNMMGMPPSFFPFPNMKPTMPSAASKSLQDTAAKDHFRDLPPLPLLHTGERNYCNVAPLVPESMNLATDSAAGASDKAPSPAQLHRTVPLTNEIPALDLKTNANENIAGERLTPGGIPASLSSNIKLTDFKSLMRKSAPGAVVPPVASVPVSKSKQKYTPIPTGGVDDPIEVSDDSDETGASLVPKLHATLDNPMVSPQGVVPYRKPSSKTSNAPPLIKPSQIPAAALPPTFPSAMSAADAIIPPPGLKDVDFIKVTKETKKLKKIQKGSKKANKAAVAPQADLSLFNVFPMTAASVGATAASGSSGGPGGDNFSKLAGGADLIPLAGTGTGLAYSSKTIPSTSLTALKPTSITTAAFEPNRREFTADEQNIFNDVTITPTVGTTGLQKKKSKEHKKLRKLKEAGGGKIKKKKDKKDKMKNKERLDQALLHDTHLEKQRNKDVLKKLKKEKKKEKQRLSINPPSSSMERSSDDIPPTPQFPTDLVSDLLPPALSNNPTTPGAISGAISAVAPTPLPLSTPTHIPKLTLKLGSVSSTTTALNPFEQDIQSTLPDREPSPELARFSPLVTRPPKQKSVSNENLSTATAIRGGADATTESKPISNKSSQESDSTAPASTSLMPPPSPWLSGGTLTASSVLLPQQLLTSIAKPKSEQISHQHSTSRTDNAMATVSSNPARAPSTGSHNPVPLITETNRPSSYVDAEGNTVWICPACGKVDDGSPMIGCDGCDAWYHWECVGIAVAPNDNEDWFCRVCITRKKGLHGGGGGGGEGSEKKRKRNKKK